MLTNYIFLVLKMKLNFNPKVWKGMALIVLLVFAVSLLAAYFYEITVSLVISIFVAGILIYPFKFLIRNGLNKVESLSFILISVTASFLVFLRYFIPVLNNEIRRFLMLYPSLKLELTDIIIRINELLGMIDSNQVLQYTNNFFTVLESSSLTFLQDASGLVIYMIFMVPILFPILTYSGLRLKKEFFSRISNKYFEPALVTWSKVIDSISTYVYAKFVESLIIFVILLIGYSIIGINGAIVLALLGGFLNILPYVGPAIGIIPPIIVALVLKNNYLLIGVIIVFLIAQMVDNVYIIPFMFSKIMNMSPITVLIVLMVGAKMLGAIGMLISYPLYMTYKIIFLEIYRLLSFFYPEGQVQTKKRIQKTDLSKFIN